MDILLEMPLTIFTALAPAGAGAFVAIALGLWLGAPSEEEGKRAAAHSLVPLALVAMAFVAAFFHLTNPLNSPWVIAGVGRSPMANEIVAGVVFFLIALAAVGGGASGKLKGAGLNGLFAAAGAAGLLFSLFIGLAYGVDTVVTWNHPALPFVSLGAALAMGAAVGCAVLVSVKPSMAFAGRARVALLVVLALGALLVVMGELVWFTDASAVTTPLVSGAERAMAVQPFVIAGAVLFGCSGLAAAVLLLRRRGGAAWFAMVALAQIAGMLLLRIAFYGMQISVGL